MSKGIGPGDFELKSDLNRTIYDTKFLGAENYFA